MGDIVNLRQARRKRWRNEARRRGDENAARSGLSAAERTAQRRAQDQAARDLDGKRRDEASLVSAAPVAADDRAAEGGEPPQEPTA